MAYEKISYKFVGTTNPTESLNLLRSQLAKAIMDNLQNDWQYNGAGLLQASGTAYPISIDTYSNTQYGNVSCTINAKSSSGGWQINLDQGTITGTWDTSYFVFKASNCIILAKADLSNGGIANGTGSVSNPGGCIVFMNQSNTNPMWSYFCTYQNVNAHYNLTTGLSVSSLISLPQPKVSQCFLANNVFGTQLSDGILAYNCNPSPTVNQFMTIDGKECFLCANGIALVMK